MTQIDQWMQTIRVSIPGGPGLVKKRNSILLQISIALVCEELSLKNQVVRYLEYRVDYGVDDRMYDTVVIL